MPPARMSQSRSSAGLRAGIGPWPVQALQSVGPAAPAVCCTGQHFITSRQPIRTPGSSGFAQRPSPLARKSAATEATSSLSRFLLDRQARPRVSFFVQVLFVRVFALGIVPGLPCASPPVREACGLPCLYELYRFSYVVPAPGAATPQCSAYSYFVLPVLGICGGEREKTTRRAARSPRITDQLLQSDSESPARVPAPPTETLSTTPCSLDTMAGAQGSNFA